MNPQSEAPPVTTGKPAAQVWIRRAILAAVVLVILVVMYFALSAFIPRWWGIKIGNIANQSFTRGIGTGLVIGAVCTFVPLFLLLIGGLRFRKRGGKVIGGIAVVLAFIAAIPNLMTLTIVLGSGNGAHSGQRSLDVEAPGFRGASLVGAIVAVLAWIAVAFFVTRYKVRGKQLRKARDREALDIAADRIERADRPHP
ncbi:permease [Antrihabitans stalactiti]|uniref:Permease n=1 Tax=Antrihabitans stalactiti TaxID=2584121 RepID=A0A848KGB4_9NOCA|nr:permease [Antrihabitans stalactiti]NMN94967.1 permease [Antrihabitans stalactiti]